MPVVGAAVATAVLGAGASGTLLFGVVSSVTTFAVTSAASFGLNYLTTAIMGKPDIAGGAQAQVQLGAEQPRRVIFGPCQTAGRLVYFKGVGKKNRTLFMVYQLSDWECDGLDKVWIQGKAYALTSTAPVGSEDVRYLVPGIPDSRVTLMFYRGRTAQTACAELVTAAADTQGQGVGAWSAAHRGAGLCYVVCKFEYRGKHDEFWDAGMPWNNLAFQMRGAPLYDWRLDSTNGGTGPQRWADTSTWVYSANPVLATYAYRRGLRRGTYLVVGQRFLQSDIDMPSFTVAANICDEIVADDVARKRYQAAVIASSAAPHTQALRAWRAAMAGDSCMRGGRFALLAGAAQVPVLAMSDTDLEMAGAEYARMRPLPEVSNGLYVTFVDLDKQGEGEGLPLIGDAAYEAEDGEQRYTHVDLPSVFLPWQARRIGTITLNKSRLQITHSGVYGPKYAVLEPGDWVTFSFACEFMPGTVVVMQVVEIEPAGRELYHISFRQVSAAAYGAPTAAITLPSYPGVVAPQMAPDTPTGLALTQAAEVQTDGTVRAAVDATWATVEGAETYGVSVRPVGGTWAETLVGGTLQRFTATAGVSYEVKVRAIDADGRSSAETAVQSITVLSYAVPPPPCTGLTATPATRAIQLLFSAPATPALAVVEVYEANSNDFALASKIAETRSTAYFRTGLEPGTVRYYWVRARDTSGNLSDVHPASNAGATAAAGAGVGGDIISAFPLVSSLPSTGNFEGRTVRLSTDEGRLYIYLSGSWGVAPDFIAAQSISANELSAITADIGEVTAGLIRSGVSGMLFDLDNNLLRSGNYSQAVDGTPLAGFRLDGASGEVKARAGNYFDLQVYGANFTGRPVASEAPIFANNIPLGGDGLATVCTYQPNFGFSTSQKLNPRVIFSRFPFSIYMDARATDSTNSYSTVLADSDYTPIMNGQLLPAAILVTEPINPFMMLEFRDDGSIANISSGTDDFLQAPFAAMKWISQMERDPLNTENAVILAGFPGAMAKALPFVVPSGFTQMQIKAWGAGGGQRNFTGGRGGPGGYTTAVFSIGVNYAIKAGDLLWAVPGEGGSILSYGQRLGFGGRGFGSTAAGGGGMSGVFRGRISRNTALVIAGGGGAGGGSTIHGSPGNDSTWSGGVTGADVVRMYGEKAQISSAPNLWAGGGGYEGGTALPTGPSGVTTGARGGRGGKGFVDTAISGYVSHSIQSSAADAWGYATTHVPPNTSDTDYQNYKTCWCTRSLAGEGASVANIDVTKENAGNGLIVIRYT